MGMSEKGGIQGHTPENSEKEQLELPKMMVFKFSSSPLQMGGATAFSVQQTAKPLGFCLGSGGSLNPTYTK